MPTNAAARELRTYDFLCAERLWDGGVNDLLLTKDGTLRTTSYGAVD
ncbi:hypothetical protein AKJ09_02025 [Labilithrix luteola]|uniref:Uncharacterized protein n=1 Tax=Labilithrix luteola TaxID=1391654 RepID=A0A0K1PPQ4_9BACT|nr:hypothetical protein AKJ09_02025 [Labilithrix luteola]